jgi:hypothetical protein
MHHHPYCTYLTVIIHEDLPFMYIGKGKTKDVLSGRYKGSVSSKQYRDIFNRLKKESPHLIHSEIINQFETNEEAIAEEIKLHAMYDVARCPVFMNKSNQTSTKFVFYGHSDGRSDATKAKISEAKRGQKHSDKTKAKISASVKGKGKTHTAEHNHKISVALKGILFSDETKEKISAAKKGKSFSDEHKSKLSLAKKGKPQQIITCPHCGKHGGGNAMKQWHFDNCKNLIKENL